MRAGIPHWSPDNKTIAFTGSSPGKLWKTFLISAEGGNSKEVTSEKLAESDATWSPEGLLAFSRSDQVHPENMELKLYDPKTRKLSAIPMSEPVFAPRWSPDGKSMAVISSDNSRLLLMDTETHKLRNLAEGMGEIGYLSWSRDSEYVYFDTLLTPEPAFYRVRVKDSKIERVVDLKTCACLPGSSGRGRGRGSIRIRMHSL